MRTLAPESQSRRRRLDRPLGRERRLELGEQFAWPARHLVPGREDDSVAVPRRHAPFLVVAFIVGGIVVPTPAVGLEDRATRLEDRRTTATPTRRSADG